MPDHLIEKIINDLTEVPSHVPFTIAPYKVSDPFIEKRLIDIIELIGEKLPSAEVSLITNGSTMTKKVLKRIADQGNIKYLRISLNDYRKEEYEQLMSLPFERTLDRLDMLHDLVRSNAFPHQVNITRVMEGNRHDIDFVNFCRSRYPNFQASVAGRNDWIGNVSETTTSPSVPDVACNRWYHVSIVATGDVALCCMDGHAEWKIGNVNESSVLEIYNSERYRNLREFTRSRLNAPSPCSQCTYI